VPIPIAPETEVVPVSGGLNTNTGTMPGFVIFPAVIVTFNWRLLTNVVGRKEPFQLTDESGRKSVPLTVNTIWSPPAFTLLGETEAMKGGGGQTPQAEQTNATDMISRQTRGDTNRLGEFRLGADRISASTLGRKVAAANDTGVAGRLYMEHLYSPSTGARAGRGA